MTVAVTVAGDMEEIYSICLMFSGEGGREGGREREGERGRGKGKKGEGEGRGRMIELYKRSLVLVSANIYITR